MATILVVDDRPINREFLVTLLGYYQHDLMQAADGAEALGLATAHHPDLVITDVLMPVMDGVEFVRSLHADPAMAHIPVIFYTATYRIGDTWQLARSCGVDTVIGKPASPEAILEAVAAKLGIKPELPPAAGPAVPVVPGLIGGNISNWMASLPQLHQHLQHLKAMQDLDVPLGAADLLSPLSPTPQPYLATATLSLRLAALLELALELGAERDFGRLLESFVRAGRDIMNAQFAAAGLVDRSGQLSHLAMRGLPEELWSRLAAASADGLLAGVRQAGKMQHLSGAAVSQAGLPDGHPPVRDLLTLPLCSLTTHYGWLYFANKLDADAFSAEDEQIATILATQLSLACENLQLFDDVQRYAGDLEVEVIARRDSEARFRELAENIREVFWVVTPSLSKILYVSPGYESLWGRSCASLYADADSWRAGVHPDDLAGLQAALLQMQESGYVAQQFRVVRPDGSVRWVRARGFPIRNAQGALLRVVGINEDITDTVEQQNRIARLNRILAMLSGINSAIVQIRQRPLLFEEACRIAIDAGQFALAWIGGWDGQQFTPLVWQAGAQPALAPLAIRFASGQGHGLALANGQVTVCEDLTQCCPADSGLPAGPTYQDLHSRAVLSLRENDAVIGVMVLYTTESGFFDDEEVRLLNELARDISFALDYMARGERLNYLACYDVLTGLSNRHLFIDRVTQLLHVASHDGSSLVVIVINIDHFKQVNDSHGRHVGDALLKQIGQRLLAALREPFSISRLGADLFAIALGTLPAHANALSVLHEKIFAAFVPAFATVAGPLQLSVRAGLALYPDDSDTAEQLLSHAEIALGQARKSGERLCYFDASVNARAVAKLALETELRQAVELGQFVVHYQPKVCLQSGSIAGAEALVRWLHPQRGLIPPDIFVPLAEETGLIVPIGEWVLRSVCAQQARWLAADLDIVPVAVNLSVVQFRRVDVVDMVRQALAAAGLDAKYLELELTESIVMNDPEGQVMILSALQKMGVALSLDDFGTGYSSLAYLKRFPFTSLKIDRSFIAEITRSAQDAAIADAAISIARRLGLKTIAEGVETEGQRHYLRRLGCDEMQGYLFSSPVPTAEFEGLLKAGAHLLPLLEAHADQRTLLLVDDEPGILNALRRVLRRQSYHVLTAGSAEEGLALLAVNDVQVIISDQRMAGMSGAEFLSLVKELYPDTIRIILSGYTDLNVVTNAVNRGAVFKFLTKPWDDDQLRENVRDAFRRHRSTRP